MALNFKWKVTFNKTINTDVAQNKFYWKVCKFGLPAKGI